MAEENKAPKQQPKHVNIYAALSAFQGELKPMAKSGKVKFPTKTGGVLEFNYTPLGEIMSTIYPILAKHGLSVRHEITKEGVEAILTHETYEHSTYDVMIQDLRESKDLATETKPFICTHKKGEDKNQIRSGIVALKGGNEMKDTGAAITYARRYTLTMVLGISSEDDHDAALLEQSAKNAIQTVFDRFKAGIEKATTPEEVKRSCGVLEKDLISIEKGKAPALGLKKAQYDELLKIAAQKVETLEGVNEEAI